jgi:hypothetical protein
MKSFLAIYIGTPSNLEKSGWNTLDSRQGPGQGGPEHTWPEVNISRMT